MRGQYVFVDVENLADGAVADGMGSHLPPRTVRAADRFAQFRGRGLEIAASAVVVGVRRRHMAAVRPINEPSAKIFIAPMRR